MSWAPEHPAARSAGGRRRPPMAAILAGVVAGLCALPAGVVALLIGAPLVAFVLVGIVRLPWTWVGGPGEVLELAGVLEGSLLAVGYFSLLVTAIVRLLAHRDRVTLLVTGLPVTLLLVVAIAVVADGWSAGLLAFLGPVVASLIALSPEVDEWAAVPASP